MTEYTDQLPRIVRVPIAGYVDIEIDPHVEVRTSTGWGDRRTDYEEAAVEAADEALANFFDAARKARVPNLAEEYSMQGYACLAHGNILYPEQNYIEDLGCD